MSALATEPAPDPTRTLVVRGGTIDAFLRQACEITGWPVLEPLLTEHGKQSPQVMRYLADVLGTGVCPVCHKLFLAPGLRRRYCSDKHRRYGAEHGMGVPLVAACWSCAVCGVSVKQVRDPSSALHWCPACWNDVQQDMTAWRRARQGTACLRCHGPLPRKSLAYCTRDCREAARRGEIEAATERVRLARRAAAS